MRDFKVDQWYFDQTYRNLTAKSPEIKTSVENFTKNLERTSSLLGLPIFTVTFTNLYKTSEHEASNEVVGRLDAREDELDEETRRQFIDAFQNKRVEYLGSLFLKDSNYEKIIQRNLQIVSWFLSRFENAFGTALDAVLHGTILGAWNAFEILSEDLWDDVARSRPYGLMKWFSGDLHPKNINISLHDICEFKRNLPENLGRLIKAQTKHVNFASYDSIKKTYKNTFSNSCPGVCKCIESDALLWLSRVRNLIVHDAGRINDEFAAAVKKCPAFSDSKLKKNKQLELNGVIIRSLIDPVVQDCCKMIGVIDKWMEKNKE